MPTENRSNDADGWIACDDGLHLIQMNKNLSHYGWVFRKINGGLPYSVREATAHEMAHALARQHLRIGVAQIAGNAPADPGEVERLRAVVNRCRQRVSKVIIDKLKLRLERDSLRGDVETMRRKNNEYWHEAEAFRAKLAELDALLHEIAYSPNVFARHFRSRIEAVLSASAEPSAPVDREASRLTG